MSYIKSVNGKNYPLYHRTDFINAFSSRTPLAIEHFARLLIEENPGNKLIIEIHPLTYHTEYHEAATINSEYFKMKTGIANAYAICSVLGIKFSVKEKKKYTGFIKKYSQAEITFILTLEGIETNQLLARAKAYRLSFENHIIQRIRSRCNDFYQQIYNSNIVDYVSDLFANKIKETIANNFISNFRIIVDNGDISLDHYDDRLAYFSFIQNGLTNLSTKNQRLGFALAVIDRASFKLKDCAVLGTKEDIQGQTTITNNMHLISHCNMDEKFDREKFELSFETIMQKRQTLNWY